MGAAKQKTGITPGQAAQLLSRVSGRPITEAMIAADLAAGAPEAKGGGVDLVRYAAWLCARRRQERRPG